MGETDAAPGPSDLHRALKRDPQALKREALPTVGRGPTFSGLEAVGLDAGDSGLPGVPLAEEQDLTTASALACAIM